MSHANDVALRALGHVTAAAGFLDFACGALLQRLAPDVKAAKHLGLKLGQIEKSLANDRVAPLREALAAWKAEANTAVERRNRAVHDPIIYGHPDFHDGLIQFRNGEAIRVDPQQLEDLAQTLETLAKRTLSFLPLVYALTGGPVEEEEQEETAAPAGA